MDAGISRTLTRVLPFAVALEVAMLARNVMIMQPPARSIVPALQVVLVVSMVAVWIWLRRHTAADRTNDVLLSGFMTAFGLIILVEMALTGNGMLAANVALVLVVGGALIRPLRHFVVFCAVLVMSWVLIELGWDWDWSIPVADQATYLVIGVAIASFVFALRRADRQALEAARDEAVHSAMRDELTGLWNRRGMTAIAPSMAVGASEVGTGVWCVFIDVRGLKQVNDTYGHDAGDDLLRAVVRALSASQVVRGVAARWGGDEFCIVGVGDQPLLEVAAFDLRRHMDTLPIPEAMWDLSLGLADAPTVEDGDFLTGLIAQADEDMYRRRGTEGRRSSASS